MAVQAVDREVIRTLERQVEASTLKASGADRSRRTHLESLDSIQCHVPALASMAGMATPPHWLYRMVGFDVLHVCFLSWGLRRGAERVCGGCCRSYRRSPQRIARPSVCFSDCWLSHWLCTVVLAVLVLCHPSCPVVHRCLTSA